MFRDEDVDGGRRSRRRPLSQWIGIIVWGITGPLFDYSDTWQLVINTGTTIVTFLMVFLIQNTQNRTASDAGQARRAATRGRQGARAVHRHRHLTDQQIELIRFSALKRLCQAAEGASSRPPKTLSTACSNVSEDSSGSGERASLPDRRPLRRSRARLRTAASPRPATRAQRRAGAPPTRFPGSNPTGARPSCTDIWEN